MSPPIPVGFVGLSKAGWASIALAPALKQLRDKYSIVAVSTLSAVSAAASAGRLSEELGHVVKSYHGDTSQIARDADVDLVFVAVKAPDHKAALLPVIQAKKNCFIEWPAGRSLAETIYLADAARASGIRSMVGLQGRQSPIMNKAKELIAQGAIGKMLSCSVIGLADHELYYWGPLVAEANAYTIDNSSGGSMLDIAVGHHLDTLTYVLGTEFTSVSATTAIMFPSASLTDEKRQLTGKQATASAPDYVAFTGLLANGAAASVSYRGGYKSTPGRRHLVWEIDGDKGSIRVENDGPSGAFVQIIPPKLLLNGEEVVVEQPSDLMSNLVGQLAEFSKGPQGNYATLDDAVKTRRLLDAIARSGSEGKRVSVL